jgi:hypothetical protein
VEDQLCQLSQWWRVVLLRPQRRHLLMAKKNALHLAFEIKSKKIQMHDYAVLFLCFIAFCFGFPSSRNAQKRIFSGVSKQGEFRNTTNHKDLLLFYLLFAFCFLLFIQVAGGYLEHENTPSNRSCINKYQNALFYALVQLSHAPTKIHSH